MKPPTRDDHGAAVVDFVLVSMVLVPLVLGIIQVALVLHVRNTLTAAATEGARYGAAIDRSPLDAAAKTRTQITASIADRFASAVTGTQRVVSGVGEIEVHVVADVPPLGLWGPAIRLNVYGHAVKEAAP